MSTAGHVIYSQYISLNDLQGLIVQEQPDIVIDLWVAGNLHCALVPDQDLEAAMLDVQYTDTVRLRIDGDQDLTALEYKHDVQLENHDNGLLFKATGPDPFIAVVFTPGVAGERYLFEVILDAPKDTDFALYFSTADNPGKFDSRHVVARKINKGYNRLLFRLPHSEVGGLIRIDPGGVTGRYLLRSLIIKALDRETKTSGSVVSGLNRPTENE